MTVFDPDRLPRLYRIGITLDDAQAFEHLWNNSEAFRLTADERTGALADFGYGALESLDVIWHELDAATAHLYMQHGLTPHQSFLLESDEQARSNLWGPASDMARVHALLGTHLSPSLIVKALYVATTPDQADRILRACAGIGPQVTTPEDAIADLEDRATALAPDVDDCDCDETGRVPQTPVLT